MIEIHCHPTKVDRVRFVCSSSDEEDRTLAVWQRIRPLVDKIDAELRRVITAAAKQPTRKS